MNPKRLLASKQQYGAAERLFEEALEAWKKNPQRDLDEPFPAELYNHYGVVLARDNQHKKAIEKLELALEAGRKAFGSQSKELAEYSNNLAVVCHHRSSSFVKFEVWEIED